MKFLLSILAVSLAAIGKSATVKIRDIAFQSPSRITKVAIKSDLDSGRYQTKFGGQAIYGNFNINQVNSAPGHKELSGEFFEYQTGCRGDIIINIHRLGRSVFRYEGSIKWLISDPEVFSKCGVTQYSEFKHKLTEAIPVSDTYGNYTPANSNTIPSETSGDITWPLWQTSSEDGLYCRDYGRSIFDPLSNGEILYQYDFEDYIFASYPRSPSSISFTRSNKRPYLLTNGSAQSCYVRANALYIKPVSLVKYIGIL